MYRPPFFTGTFSPGYQTKYFEISVVWDSQSGMSFTLFMYVELKLERKESRTVELRNVIDSTLFIHSKNVCDQCLFCTLFPQVYLWHTLINLTQFLQQVSNVCCLHLRMTLNSVHLLKLQIRCYVPVGCNCTPLIMSPPVGLGDIWFLPWSSVTKSCLLCNSKTVWDIFMKLYTNVKNYETTCRAQEP